MTQDHQLLQSYVRQRSRSALDELIRRHLGLVYSSALRQTRGNSHLAEDVTQAVFIVLAAKAHTIRQGASIGSWLISVTRRAALNAIRQQTTRVRHELAASKAEAAMDHSTDWNLIAPLLDEALNLLGRKDRDAVVMRFLQDRSFAQVGMELGLNEAAARKRVSRAIEKLRQLLSRYGASVGTAALGSLIASNGVKAAPALLAISSPPTAAATTISKQVINMILWAKIKLAGAIATGIAIFCGGALVLTSMAQIQAPLAQNAPATRPATLPTTTSAKFDPVAARQAIALRFFALQNLSYTFHSESSAISFPRGVGAPAGGNVRGGARVGTGPTSDDQKFSRLGTNIRSERGREGANGSKAISTVVVREDGLEALTEATAADGTPRYSGGTGKEPFSNRDPSLMILGLARTPFSVQRTESTLLTDTDLDSMEISATPQGTAVLSRRDTNGGYEEQWEFHPEMEYAVTAYRLITPGMLKPSPEIVASDFHRINGVMLPSTVRVELAPTINGEAKVTQVTQITLKDYKIGDPQNTPAKYHLTFPEGTTLTIAPSSAVTHVVKNGKIVSLDDVAVEQFKQLNRTAPTQPSVGGTIFGESVDGLLLNSQASQHSMLDLDKAIITDGPSTRQLGTDLIIRFLRSQNGATTWQLTGWDTLLFKLPTEAWDKRNLAVVKAAITAGDPGVRVSIRSSTDRKEISYTLGPTPLLPIAFAYRTGDGGIGMMRITKLEENAPGPATIDVIRLREP